MHTSLQKIYNQLEQQRLHLTEQVIHVPNDKFNESPAAGQWSLSQVLTHIVTAERLSTDYMKKKIQGVDQVDYSGLREEILFLILQISQRIPALKFKAPTVVVQNTPAGLPLSELIQTWETQRQELKKFLDSMEEKNIKKVIYKHPIAGRLNAWHAVAFFREHIIHHMPQIKRLLLRMS